MALSLQELDGGTELHLTQGEFATQARLALHEGGWTESLERLKQMLVEAPAARRGGSTDPTTTEEVSK